MMPRPRKKAHQKLPKYVYLDKGRYFLKPYVGLVNGKPTFGKQIWLAPDTATIDEIWEAYTGHNLRCQRSHSRHFLHRPR